jgi:hypothetical protein
MLEQLDIELNKAGVHLAFADLRARLRDRVLRYGLYDTLDPEHFHPTLQAAVDDVERHLASARDSTTDPMTR